jgi:hypothetical protein
MTLRPRLAAGLPFQVRGLKCVDNYGKFYEITQVEGFLQFCKVHRMIEHKNPPQENPAEENHKQTKSRIGYGIVAAKAASAVARPWPVASAPQQISSA